jgi:hypothetical protein
VDDGETLNLAAGPEDLLQAFGRPSRLIAGEKGIGNDFAMLVDSTT